MNEHLRRHSNDYLTTRRSLGFKLVGEGRLLHDLVRFAEKVEVSTLTTRLAVAWTRSPATAGPDYLARRMRVARGFATYLHTLDPATQVPPADLFPARNQRPTPHIYTDAEILALLAAAGQLTPVLRAATYQTLIGLLAATGMRIGEAMALGRDDIDWSNQMLTVRDSKFGKSREILLHSSAVVALQRYARVRNRLSSRSKANSFFVSTRGTRLTHHSAQPTLRQVRHLAAVGDRFPRPRIHDLRHTFAVNTLLDWYRDGGDVAARIPLLSTYLGHVDPAATYWYLSAVPELLALAARRLELASGGRS